MESKTIRVEIDVFNELNSYRKRSLLNKYLRLVLGLPTPFKDVLDSLKKEEQTAKGYLKNRYDIRSKKQRTLGIIFANKSKLVILVRENDAINLCLRGNDKGTTQRYFKAKSFKWTIDYDDEVKKTLAIDIINKIQSTDGRRRKPRKLETRRRAPRTG